MTPAEKSAAEKRRGVFLAEVTANETLCREHFRLRLAMQEFPPTRPGQFVQLQCRPVAPQASLVDVDWSEGKPPKFTQAELTDREPLLRRPLSLGGRRELASGGVELEIIYRAVGTGTRWLSGLAAGGEVSVLGPLGNAFRIWPDKPQAALIGGGVGIPPMLYLAEALQVAGKESFAFAGARTASLLPLNVLDGVEISSAGRPSMCVAEFAQQGTATALATDDGSLGFGGTVSEAFRNWLNAHVEDEADLVVYCCGPEPLMQAVADICLSREIECQLAMERHMACGMGTCQSCIIKTHRDAEAGWSYKLCCTDGPVFDAREIIW